MIKLLIYRYYRRILKKIKQKQHERIANKRETSWNMKFRNRDFFEYSLSTDLKINLYKESVLSRLIYDGFEIDERIFLSSILTKGDFFLDIGANIGLYTLLASKLVGTTGTVISFEPSPNSYIRLIENIKLNNLTNVEPRNIGLSDQKGILSFYTSLSGYDAWDSFAPSLDDKLEKEIKIPVSTLDHELVYVNKELIKAVKIDVEGWEKFVLFGGRNFLQFYHPILIIEFTDQNTLQAGYPVHDIFDLIQSWGYKWHRIKDGELVLEEKQEEYPYINLIAIKTFE